MVYIATIILIWHSKCGVIDIIHNKVAGKLQCGNHNCGNKSALR